MEQQLVAGAGSVGLPPRPAHPEEASARVAVELGGGRSFVATARATPAGLVSVGLLVSGILLSIAVLVRAARPRA
ncbi:hypothetical protein [Roseomonas sp. 18066]|uniref:hypothetical protein n=1 Tax=Roseomonas sp. 18066 TaxID=2681412 RepID=UPI001358718F|nr:hypothetical protein [Roseomonas sp. 18066]